MVDPTAVRAFFEAQYPRLRRRARASLKPLYGAMLDDAIANAIALAYENLLSCARQGKVRSESDLARYAQRSLYWACKHAMSGRTFMKKTSDADRTFGDVLDKMGKDALMSHYLSNLPDDRDDVLEVVALRCDWSEFLATIPASHAELIRDVLTTPLSGVELAEKHGITPGRVSQIRRRIVDLYHRYVGE